MICNRVRNVHGPVYFLLVSFLATALLLGGCTSKRGEGPPRTASGGSVSTPGEVATPGDGEAEADAEAPTKVAPPLVLSDGRVLVPGLSSTPGAVGKQNALTQVSSPNSPNIQAVVSAWQSANEVTAGSGVSVAVVEPSSSGTDSPTVTTYVAGTKGVGTSGDASTPVTSGTRFEIGSETKTFTGALLAQLVSTGKVSLDDPLSKYAPPGYATPMWTAGGSTTQMTIGNLATHQSGLPRVPANLGTGPTAKESYTESMMWQAVSETALLWQPGTNWLYSNFGFGVLGTVLANIAQPGQSNPPYGAVVGSILTSPAGMPSTVIENCSAATCPQMPNLATPYLPGNRPAPYWNNSGAIAGAGGLVSNAPDMGVWVADTLGYPSAISGFAPQATNPISQIGTICTKPNACKASPGGFRMGMSWQLYQSGAWLNEPFVFKNGGTAGMHSATYLVPGRRIAVTVLSNSPNSTAVSQLGQYVVTALLSGSG